MNEKLIELKAELRHYKELVKEYIKEKDEVAKAMGLIMIEIEQSQKDRELLKKVIKTAKDCSVGNVAICGYVMMKIV